jgi:hypothetical protein
VHHGNSLTYTKVLIDTFVQWIRFSTSGFNHKSQREFDSVSPWRQHHGAFPEVLGRLSRFTIKEASGATKRYCYV